MSSPSGTMLYHPIDEGTFEADIAAGFLTFEPFVA
jgi:hypothetical protein